MRGQENACDRLLLRQHYVVLRSLRFRSHWDLNRTGCSRVVLEFAYRRKVGIRLEQIRRSGSTAEDRPNPAPLLTKRGSRISPSPLKMLSQDCEQGALPACVGAGENG